MTKPLQHTTFHYSDDHMEFVADPQDIRSVAIFYDSNGQEWCAGVAVKENYTKLRFPTEGSARAFAMAAAEAKDKFAERLAYNQALSAAARQARPAANG